MTDKIFTWPSVQIDSNIPKVSKINNPNLKITEFLDGAPDDSDTIVKLLLKIHQLLESLDDDILLYIDSKVDVFVTELSTELYNNLNLTQYATGDDLESISEMLEYYQTTDDVDDAIADAIDSL